MPTFKYIITDTGAILFNENTTHSQVAEGFDKVYSAGFVSIEFGLFKVEVKSYGKSESLKLKSIPEKDEFIIKDLFASASEIKYYAFNVKSLYNE